MLVHFRILTIAFQCMFEEMEPIFRRDIQESFRFETIGGSLYCHFGAEDYPAMLGYAFGRVSIFSVEKKVGIVSAHFFQNLGSDEIVAADQYSPASYRFPLQNGR